MNGLEFVQEAKAKSAREILFMLGQPTLMKVKLDWEQVSSQSLTLQEWKSLLNQLLNPLQRQRLEAEGSLSANVVWGSGERATLSAIESAQSFKLLLEIETNGAQEIIPVPQVLIDELQKKSGVVVLTGPSAGVRLQLLDQALKRAILPGKRIHGALLSANPIGLRGEFLGQFVFAHIQDSDAKRVALQGADVVVINGEFQEWEDAVKIAESGRLVVFSVNAPSVQNFLHTTMAELPEKGRMHWLWRMADRLNLIVGVHECRGIEKQSVFPQEVLVVTPQVRDLLEKENIRELDLNMKRSAEGSGLQTLNQSLLQHLIRRKIDLKTAFEVSRDPGDLDALLKKVGI